MKKEEFEPGTFHFIHPITFEHLATATITQWEPSCHYCVPGSLETVVEDEISKGYYDLGLRKFVRKNKPDREDHDIDEVSRKFVHNPDKQKKRLREKLAALLNTSVKITYEGNEWETSDVITAKMTYDAIEGSPKSRVISVISEGEVLSIRYDKVPDLIVAYITEVERITTLINDMKVRLKNSSATNTKAELDAIEAAMNDHALKKKAKKTE